ncbi:hypothetical protein GI374_10235 [Paracoccus sp. S-4012]|uniref:DUF2231 domain-containing protein n=1 Tax=Paracoccus sp. S-4012 TaxID=2665648 RepID=UPI0012AFEFEA|nr:DUF2231 domain-containing protein [Paracoccus sp. S-4012]MRX50816.1 hypothetical protein [Paracoccus sp. S-4012]
MPVVALSTPGLVRPIHPLHAILLGFPFPLFLGGLVSDLAYRSTFQVQWANFAAWLNAGGLAIGALALLWALVNLFRGPDLLRRRGLYFITLFAMWVLGLINAFVHARDAWAIMPEAIWLSAITTVLAFIAAWIGYSGFDAGDAR